MTFRSCKETLVCILENFRWWQASHSSYRESLDGNVYCIVYSNNAVISLVDTYRFGICPKDEKAILLLFNRYYTGDPALSQ